jgi:hypothetical protein
LGEIKKKIYIYIYIYKRERERERERGEGRGFTKRINYTCILSVHKKNEVSFEIIIKLVID